MEVAVWQGRAGHRARLVSEAMAKGCARMDRVSLLGEATYGGSPRGEVAVFYGLQGNLARIFKDYVKAGLKAVYIDLGYWQRHQDGRYNGYHKLCVNSRHPTAYFQNKAHDDARWRRLNQPDMEPWRRHGEQIIVAGMSEKAARAEGFAAQQWERQAVEVLRKHTQRQIVYRPKPNWNGATPIHNSVFGDKSLPLHTALKNCHALVTHHSNAAIEALQMGVPVFVMDGVAVPMGIRDLEQIENPIHPEDRQQWAQDLAYTQWTLAEMHSGAAWRHLREEGLV